MYKCLTVALLRFVVLFFIFAVMVAIYFYTGGNIHNPAQLGYSITHNFLSDLGGYQSHSGAVNVISAFFFNTSMFMFLGVGIAFLFVPRLFKGESLNHALAIVGSAFFFSGTTFFAGVGLTPHDLYLELHTFFALNAFRFLVPGSLAYLIVLLRSPVDNKYALVTMAYLISTFSYVMYQLIGDNALASQEAMVRQATIQKLIVLVSVGTIFSLTFAFSSRLKQLKLN